MSSARRPRAESGVSMASQSTVGAVEGASRDVPLPTGKQLAALDTSVDVNQLVPAGSVYAFGAEFQAATLAKGDGLSEVEFVQMLLKYLEHDSDEEDDDEPGTAGASARQASPTDTDAGSMPSAAESQRKRGWRRRRTKSSKPSPRSRLREEFKRRRVVKKMRKKSDLVVDLCELFAQIDFNGDGTVEWPEFTSFCVEAGMVASQNVTKPVKYIFKQRGNYVDRTTEASQITFMRYCPAMDRVLVCEEGSIDLKIYTPELKLVKVLRVALPLPDRFAMRKPAAAEIVIATDNATRFAAVRQKFSAKHRNAVQGITAARLSKPRPKTAPASAPAGLMSSADREMLAKARAAEKAAEEEAKRTNILTAGRGKQNLDADVLVVPRDLLRGRTRRSHMGKVLSVSLSATRRVFKQAKERAIARRRQDASSVKVLNEEAGAQEDERRWSLSGATHIPEHKLIAVACDDCTVTLWRDDTFAFHGAMYPNNPQTCIRWCPDTGYLVSGCAKGIVTAWNLETLRPAVRLGTDTVPLRTIQGKTLSGKHTDCVMDVVEVPAHKLVLTAGMDARIALWSYANDDKRLRFAGDLGQFSHGVRQLVYLEQADVLVAVGFGHEVTAWDLSSRLLLSTISGHRHTVLCATATTSTPQCLVTGDAAGNFKVWLLKRNSMHHSPPLLQTFDTSNDLSKYAAKVMCPSGANHGLLCGARRLVMFDSVRKIDLDDSPTMGLYCDKRSAFVTTNGDGLTVWSAFTGKPTNKFYNLSDEPVTSMAVDRRQRKVIVGTSSGRILVVNSRNGYLMKSCAPHTADITALVYCALDQTIVSVSWDRSLVVHDEKPNTEDCPALRTVTNAHDADINCLAYSRELSLLGTGAADGTLRVWDYQSVKLVGVCEGHEDEITSVKFCAELPLLVASDGSGLCLFWATRPSLWNCRCMLGFRNLGAGPEAKKPVNGGVATDRAAKAFPPDHMGPVPISTMDLHCHFDTQGNKVIWVFTGDEQGMVKLWDITPFANHLPINPLPEEKQPCNLGSYNPRMRLRRVFAGVDHGGITAKERPFQQSKGVIPTTSVAEPLSVSAAAQRLAKVSDPVVSNIKSRGPKAKGKTNGRTPVPLTRSSSARSINKDSPRSGGEGASPSPRDRLRAHRRSSGLHRSRGSVSGSARSIRPARLPKSRRRGSLKLGDGGTAAAVETLGLIRGESVRTLMSGRGDDIPEIVETASVTGITTVPVPDIPDDALGSAVHPVTRSLLSRTLTLRRLTNRKRAAAKHLATLSEEERAAIRFAGTMRGIHATMRAKRRARAKLRAQKNFTPREWALSRVRADLNPAMQWKAANDGIKDLRWVPEPRSVITTSHDLSIRIWSPVGEPIGVLNCTPADIRAGIRTAVPWRFRIDIQARRQALIDHAKEVSRQMVVQEHAARRARLRRETAASLMTAARTTRSEASRQHYHAQLRGFESGRRERSPLAGTAGMVVAGAPTQSMSGTSVSRATHTTVGGGRGGVGDHTESVSPVANLMRKLTEGSWDVDSGGGEVAEEEASVGDATGRDPREDASRTPPAVGGVGVEGGGNGSATLTTSPLGATHDLLTAGDSALSHGHNGGSENGELGEGSGSGSGRGKHAQLRSSILEQMASKRERYSPEVVMVSQIGQPKASPPHISGVSQLKSAPHKTRVARPTSAPAVRSSSSHTLRHPQVHAQGSTTAAFASVATTSVAPTSAGAVMSRSARRASYDAVVGKAIRHSPEHRQLHQQQHAATAVAVHAVRSKSVNPLAAAALARAQAQALAQLSTPRAESNAAGSSPPAPTSVSASSALRPTAPAATVATAAERTKKSTNGNNGSRIQRNTATGGHQKPPLVTPGDTTMMGGARPPHSGIPAAVTRLNFDALGRQGGTDGSAYGRSGLGRPTTTPTAVKHVKKAGGTQVSREINREAMLAMQQAELQVLQEDSSSTVPSQAPSLDLEAMAAKNIVARNNAPTLVYENYQRESQPVSTRTASVLNRSVDTTPSNFLASKLDIGPNGKLKPDPKERQPFGSKRRRSRTRPGTAPSRRRASHRHSQGSQHFHRRGSSASSTHSTTMTVSSSITTSSPVRLRHSSSSSHLQRRPPRPASASASSLRGARHMPGHASGKGARGMVVSRSATGVGVANSNKMHTPAVAMRRSSSSSSVGGRRQSFKERIDAATGASPWLEKALANAAPISARSSGSSVYAQTVTTVQPAINVNALPSPVKADLRKRIGSTMERFHRMMEETQQDQEAFAAIRGKLGDHWARGNRKTLIQRQKEYAVRLRDPDDSSSEDSDSSSSDEGATRHQRRGRNRSRAAEVWNQRRFGDYSLQDVVAFKRMYHEIDQDGSGTINIEEFMHSDSFRSSQMFYMSKSVFKSLDSDGSGDIEIDELLPVVFPLATKRQLREIAQEVLVRIRRDLMSAEAKRMKWQQGSESNELAASLALVDKAVEKFGTTRGAAEKAVGAVKIFQGLGSSKKSREDARAEQEAAGETAEQLNVSRRAAAAARGLARFSEVTSRTVSKLRARIASQRLKQPGEEEELKALPQIPEDVGTLEGISRGLYSR